MQIKPSNVIAVIAAIMVGRCSADLPPPQTITETVYKTVAPAALLARVEALQMEKDGLRAALAGRSRLKPDTVIVTDTLVMPPDTVLQLVSLDSNARLSLATLVARDTLWAPEIHSFDVSRCDDGFSWAAGALVCDRARLGHLKAFTSIGVGYAGASFAAQAAVGLTWKSSNKSPWRADLGVNATGRAGLDIVREWSW